MQENKWQTDVRMFYEKKGMAKYISHLDMVRCFSRAMKRADVPIWFTEALTPTLFDLCNAVVLGHGKLLRNR